MGANYVALIPAKGTSFGVAQKNLQIVGDNSLLARAIEAAKSVGRISRTVVSTESDEIARNAEKLGVQVHMRGPAASHPEATAAEVVDDFLRSEAEGHSGVPLTVVYLQPTSPFRSPSHIESALDLLENERSGSVISVCAVKQLPEKMLDQRARRVHVDQSGVVAHGANRQDLPRRLYPNGAIYVFSEAEFRVKNEVPVDGSLFIEMDEISSLDIDSPADLEIARALATHAGI